MASPGIPQAPDLRTIAESEHWSPGTTVDSSTGDSDKTFAVPSGKERRIKVVRVELTSTTQSGSRQMEVQFRSTADAVLYGAPAGATQGSTVSRNYNFSPESPDLTGFRDTDKLTTPIPDMVMGPDYDVRVFDNAAIDATGDSMTVRIGYLERDEPTT